MDTKLFYKKLKKQKIPIHELLNEIHRFEPVPDNWYVVVADIENSTEAVNNGLHGSVNLAATGSIIAVLNELKQIDATFKIPYFFGGDGATFLIPGNYIIDVVNILDRYTVHVKNTMFLTLRADKMAVSEVYKNGHSLKITKFKLNTFLTVPVVLGLGLKFAEKEIKKNFTDSMVDSKVDIPVNLDGMECRWDEIKPDSSEKKVVCLIVNSVKEQEQSKIFSDILQEIHTLFGSLEERIPISTRELKLDTTISKIRREMIARLGKSKLSYLIKNWSITFFGKFYFEYFKDGQEYLYKVSQLSDTLMIDGSINTVISGTAQQLQSLELFLDGLESDKKINYGMHKTYASIMSCYVQDRKDNHIHFVDGTEGGYTSAAMMIKKKKNLIVN
ncbi:DUF3095 family protein [uncultured Dokdonia sp.]|uniref:DUF3095 family protein n=1 Tax=uncultured Dokdonia sp. TaxID=575653 RepID=UPI00260BE0F2|nr:DUF3095 family protein [uncultured Dokdonia sp.]